MVEHLTLKHRNNMQSVEMHMEIEREMRKIFGPLSNLSTLRVDDEFVEELSSSLWMDDEGHPLELLPEQRKLAYPQSRSGYVRDVFISFIGAHQSIGCPETLIRL